jgi:hypothetical protein
MLVHLRAVLIGLIIFYASPLQAQLVDQMLSVQAATTSIGKLSDSTTLTKGHEQDAWSSRTFTAKASEVCEPGRPSSIGIANGGTGITDVDVRNAKGEVSITWVFGGGISASNFPYSSFEVDIVNSSTIPEIVVGAVFTLSTDVTDITVGYSGVRVPSSLSSVGKTVPFKFRAASPALFKRSSTIIRSATLRVVPKSGCDSALALQLARFAPRNGAVIKRKEKPRGGGSGRNVAGPGGTAIPTETAKPNPCEENASVAEEIRRCEEDANRRASNCATWECHCFPTLDGRSYSITASTASASDAQTVGKACLNTICGGVPSRCTDWAECIPEQFLDFNNPFIGVSADGVTFRGSNNPLDPECFNLKLFPNSRQLCTMSIEQVEQAFLASMMPGAPCELAPGTVGACDNTGVCVPDISAAYFCKDKVDCTPCGAAGHLCRKGACLSLAEAQRQLCESTGFPKGGHGICSPCFAMFSLNADGSCGTGVIAPDKKRGVSMEGASCTRLNENHTAVKGECRAGVCDLYHAVPTATPTPGGTPAP